MSKEVLYAKIKFHSGSFEHQQKSIEALNEFFKDKVIIQRGDNRHPYADVLHAMAEGAESEFSSDNGASWVGVLKELYYCEAYRIKPSEPISEFMVVDENGIIDWMSYEEFHKQTDFKFIAIKTKRERK